MDFVLGYRDPLFGLILFVGLVFIASFFSYWWAVVKLKKQQNSLQRFFQELHTRFDTERLSEEEILWLLAKSYEQNGKYEKAIALYLRLGESLDPQKRVEVLKRLGDLYLKIGFLARSQKIYEEILGHYPRRIDVLERLLRVYEQMERYDQALEVVQILGELGHESLESVYVQARYLVRQGKTKELLELYQEHPFLVRVVGEYLFAKDPKLAWESIWPQDLPKIADILWYLPKEHIRTHTPFLQELYSAKGYVDLAKRSQIFELDILLHYPKAILEFEYLCPKCKGVVPLGFTRCPLCQGVKPPVIEYVVAKRREGEESLSV